MYSCHLLRSNGVLFAILSDSLAGPAGHLPAQCGCPGTLAWRRLMCQTQGIRLAAQVEVLLGWHRLQDAPVRRAAAVYKQACAVRWTVCCCAAPMSSAAAGEPGAGAACSCRSGTRPMVQMTLSAKNYSLAAEPMSNLYGALLFRPCHRRPQPAQEHALHRQQHRPRCLPAGQG